jgi:hypothetical protein
MPIWLKFFVMMLLLVMTVGVIWIATLYTISVTQNEKYRKMEDTAVTAAEQIMNMSVETAVSIAKNIYINEAIYEFLNTRYTSASSYYETYYPLQQNTAMNLAETNIVKRCTIYTDNPTILSGGNIQKLEPAKSEYWYQIFQRMEKPTILCIDPDTASLVLVRKLDYRSLETGDSYVCLEMNNAILGQFVENLGFEGELYVLSGSNLLYSSQDTVKSIDDVVITPDFDCLARNYYTVDIEFYSYAARRTIADHLRDDSWLVTGLSAVLLFIIVISYLIFFNIRKRINPVVRQYQHTGAVLNLEMGKNGKDEVGQLLDVCCDMAKHIADSGGQSEQDSENLLRQSKAYNDLFLTAMRQDAELSVIEKLPDLRLENPAVMIPLSEELELLQKAAEKLGARFNADDIPENQWTVPAYSLLLIADDIFRRFIDPSVTVTFLDDTAYISFESPKTPKSADMLKLRAIFEDSNISEAYDFSRSYRFNPYMRLKACLGNGADIEIIDRNMFRLIFKLTQETP